jgi:hypothetical protein
MLILSFTPSPWSLAIPDNTHSLTTQLSLSLSFLLVVPFLRFCQHEAVIIFAHGQWHEYNGHGSASRLGT